MLRQLWKRQSRRHARLVRYARPRLELLESRAVPASLTFDNVVPVSVVDNATVRSSLLIPAHGRIIDLNVTIDLDHTSAPDLTVSLVAPDGVTRVVLFSGLGNPGDAFHNLQVAGAPVHSDTVLDDQAADPISAATTPFVGTYRPAEPLSTFDGLDLAGTWKLEITDAHAGNVGTLSAWSLTADVVQPDLVATSFDVAERTVAWGSTATVRFTLKNQGDDDAGPFAVDVRLSTDALITAADTQVLAFQVPALAAGAEYSSQLTVQVPGGVGVTPPGFAGRNQAFLGLLIDPADAVSESDEANNQGQRPTIDVDGFTPVTPLAETENNDVPAQANAVTAPFQVAGTLPAGDRDYFRFDVPATGRFVADVDSTADVAVELYTAAGQLVVRSEPTPGGAAAIDQHLLPGSYLLKLAPRVPAPTIAYQLRGDFSPADPPGLLQAAGSTFSTVVAADLDRDGRMDLITSGANGQGVGVLLGSGDGTFRGRQDVLTGFTPSSLVVADFDGDGRPDLAASFSNGVSAFRGNGDGTFGAGQILTSGRDFFHLVAADVNGDGVPDLLAIGGGFDGTVGVLLGNGDGSFQPLRTFAAGQVPTAIAAADVDGDGNADLLVTELASLQVFVLRGGRGDFALSGSYHVGDPPFIEAGEGAFFTGPLALAVADFDGDGHTDVVTANNGSSDVSLLLGNGDGTFQPERRLKAGTGVVSVAAADVNGDGRPDVLVANSDSGDLSVLLGNGDGTFQPAARYADVGHPQAVSTADVNGDGRLDLLAPSGVGVGVLLGNGDGSFQTLNQSYAGAEPVSVLQADLNADGRPDLIVSNFEGDNLSVLLGNGDGSFQPQQLVAVGHRPVPLTAADVNGDGRLDLIAANTGTGDVSVLLGNGDGSFQTQRRFLLTDVPRNAVNLKPISLTATDFDGDGRLDLVVVNGGIGVALGDTSESLLRGNGDGTFGAALLLPAGPEVFSGDGPAVADLDGDGTADFAYVSFVGTVTVHLTTSNSDLLVVAGPDPRGVALGDVDGDGRLDLLVVDGNADVSALQGRGGAFGPPVLLAAGAGSSRSVRAADLDGDGRADLITFRYGTPAVGVLFAADGFRVEHRLIAGLDAVWVTAADINGDGRPDLIATAADYSVNVLANAGAGSFRTAGIVRPGDSTPRAVVSDFNNDGRQDQAVIDRNTDQVRVLLGNPDGTFSPFAEDQATPARHRPLLADLDGDGILDEVVTDDRGRVIFRRGMRGNLFQAPVLVNPDVLARDLAVVRTPSGFAVATTDVTGDTVSLYSWRGGAFVRATVAAGQQPARLAASDLDGNGLDDLVVASPMTNSVRILLQRADGSFASVGDRPVGGAPVDVAFADVDGQNGPDVVVTDRTSGDVTVLFNDPAHIFTATAHYRAGLGSSGLQLTVEPRLTSLEQPVSLATGDFTGDGVPDVLVLAQEARQARLLVGTGTGLRNPVVPFSLAPPGEAAPTHVGEARAADLDGDGDLDLAVVMEDRGQVWVYLNDGHGHFELKARVPVGEAPAGLSIAQLDDDNGDGKIDRLDHPDLLVGNGAGDVLSVLGNGDGTFRPFVRADQRVPFVVTDLDGDGTLDVVLADQARDRAAALNGRPVPAGANNQLQAAAGAFTPGAFQRDASGGLIGPGDVAVADVNGDGLEDLIFANTGSNNVLVYLRQPGGSFAQQPLSFFTGTSPVALHPAQLNDDNGDGKIDGNDLLDLVVANEGSNDVSVLLGVGGADLFEQGPRLPSGGAGPNAVTTRDVNGDGIPDVLATNGQSGTVATIPGIGNVFGLGTGAFDSADTRTMKLSDRAVIQTQVIDPTLGFALTQDGELIRFSPSGGDAQVVFTSEVGREVLAFSVVQTAGQFGGSPVVFVADADGSVSLLTQAAGQAAYAEILSGSSGLGTPSALEALERADGVFEIYLTQSGESTPVLLTLNLRAELRPTDPADPTAPVIVLVTDLGGPGDEAGSSSAAGPADPTRPQPAETVDALTAGRATALALEEADLEGETVSGAGAQLIAFVLKRQDGFAVGGEGEEQAEEPVSATVEDTGSAADRVRGLVIGSKEELERLARPEQPEEGEELPQQHEGAEGENQTEPPDEEPAAAVAMPAAPDEPPAERRSEAAVTTPEEPPAAMPEPQEAGSAWALVPGALVAVAEALGSRRAVRPAGPVCSRRVRR